MGGEVWLARSGGGVTVKTLRAKCAALCKGVTKLNARGKRAHKDDFQRRVSKARGGTPCRRLTRGNAVACGKIAFMYSASEGQVALKSIASHDGYLGVDLGNNKYLVIGQSGLDSLSRTVAVFYPRSVGHVVATVTRSGQTRRVLLRGSRVRDDIKRVVARWGGML